GDRIVADQVDRRAAGPARRLDALRQDVDREEGAALGARQRIEHEGALPVAFPIARDAQAARLDDQRARWARGQRLEDCREAVGSLAEARLEMAVELLGEGPVLVERRNADQRSIRLGLRLRPGGD